MKFLVKVAVAAVGIYGIGEYLRKTQILEQAIATWRPVIQQTLLEAAREALARQQQQQGGQTL